MASLFPKNQDQNDFSPMNPALIFTDIDGTLLDKERKISAATAAEVKRITQLKIPFILISSRMPRAMTHLQEDLMIAGLPLIAYNGGLVLAAGKTIHSQAIEIPVIKRVAQVQQAFDFSISLYFEDEWYVAENDHYAQRETNNTRTHPELRPLNETIADFEARQIGAHKVMCMGEPAHLDQLIDKLEASFPNQLHLYRSKADYLEIADARISKLTGIQALIDAAYPGVSLEECMAFGDNYNDVEMLRGVGTGIAVANARPQVKAVANHLVAHNKADGVAEGLLKFVR